MHILKTKQNKKTFLIQAKKAKQVKKNKYRLQGFLSTSRVLGVGIMKD